MQKRGRLSKAFIWGIVLVLIAAILLTISGNSREEILQADSPSTPTFQSVLDAARENSQLLVLTLVDEDTPIQSNSEFEIDITNTSDKEVGSIKLDLIIRSEITFTNFPDNPQKLVTHLESQEIDTVLEPDETITVPIKLDFGLREPDMLSILVYGYFVIDGIVLEPEEPFNVENRVGGTLEVMLAP